MFMFSTEEVTLAAMRRGRDGKNPLLFEPVQYLIPLLDVMMFLNVAVAITCCALCWTLCMVAFKGWLKLRMVGTVAYRE